jgi:hypothetical protein
MRESRSMSRPTSVLLVVISVALVSAFASPAASAATACPASFTVLHNDRVGTMSIPRGPYFLEPTGLSCAAASSLLRRFLSDYDGRLPGGWTTAPAGLGFVNPTTNQSFTLGTVAPPNGGGGRCPGTFTVEHNDRIGALRLRAGRYRIRATGMSCASASRQFAFFLDYDYAGKLPPGWRLNVAKKRFSRGAASFTVRQVGGTGGGGGVHPHHAITCPGKVTLAAGTRIGSLVVPSGSYYVNVFSALSCTRAKALFAQFAAAGAVPPDWVVEPETGVFLLGRDGFQIEPA